MIPIRFGLGLAVLARVDARRRCAGAGAARVRARAARHRVHDLQRSRERASCGKDVDPLPLPADAVVASRGRQAFAATLPSTLGVTALAAIALVPQPVLAALLGGVCAGLGLAALLSLGRIDPSLYVDPKSDVVYRR